MLHFTNAPPPDPSGPGLRLRRTPNAGKLTAIITCRRLIGTPTHFYQHRTIPCQGSDCPACNANHPWRWHGYLSAIDSKTNEHFLFEMTAQAAEPFTNYFQRHGTLLGCMFEATRLGEHHNGRVLIRCKPVELTKINLPNEPDLIGCLCHIWNIPRPEATIDGLTKQHDRIRINKNDDGNNRPIPKTQSQT